MKEGIRRSLAAVMAAAIVGGAGLPAGVVTGLSGASSLTASAWEESSVVLENGILRLSGAVTKEEIRQYLSYDLSMVYAQPGTVLPVDCSGMFEGFTCSAFDLSNADAENVFDMSGMFASCASAKVINLGSMNTRFVRNMSSMFSGCSSLESIDLSGLNTVDVTDMSNMFGQCISLKSLDLKTFSTYYVTDMSNMFYNCKKLTDLDIRTFDTTYVTNMDFMFTSCSSLTELNIYGFSSYSLKSMMNMFSGCSALKTIYAGDKWYNVPSSKNVFEGCSVLRGGSGTPCSSNLTGSVYARIDGGSAVPGYFTRFENDCCSFDAYTGKLTLRGIVNNDRVHEYAMDYNVRSVVAEEGTILPNRCSELFRDFQAESIDLSKAYSSNVYDTFGMFRSCMHLKSLDLTGFDTSKVRCMDSMFEICRELEELDLSSFDTHNVDIMMNMFSGCESLRKITVGDLWSTERLDPRSSASSTYMFMNCFSLTGGNGTPYDPGHTDKTYARIDSVVTPGYLSGQSIGFRTNSMTLGGSISLNFYVGLDGVPDDLLDQCFVEFTVNGKKQKAKLDRSRMNASKTAYGFNCKLNSVSMADKVQAVLIYYTPDRVRKTKTTVSTAETYLRKFDSVLDAGKTWDLISSINDYGYYMQQYLSVHSAAKWKLGIDHQAMEMSITRPDTYRFNKDKYLSELSDKQKSFGSNTNIAKVNYSLVLDSETSINFKIRKREGYTGTIKVYVDGKAVTPKTLTDGRLQVTASNIPAHKLGDMHTVKITTASGTTTYKASVLSYIYECINDPGDSLEYDAMSALYEYYKAAVAYKQK